MTFRKKEMLVLCTTGASKNCRLTKFVTEESFQNIHATGEPPNGIFEDTHLLFQRLLA